MICEDDMKRLFVLFLTFCLLLPLPFAVSAAEEKRFYVQVTRPSDGGFRADICWTGATEEDNVSAIRFRLSYPEDKLVCKENGVGDALRAFSIRMGPQYPNSNPAGFVGAEINHAVTEAGSLGYFLFEPVEGASGTAELKLELIEAIRLDNSDCKGIFAVENGVIELDKKTDVFDDLCGQSGIGHVPGAWQTDAEQKDRLVKKCTLCGAICEEKQIGSATTDPVKKEEVTLRPGKNPIPEKAELSILEVDETPSDGLLMEVAGAFDLSEPKFLGALRIELTLDGEEIELSEDATLSVPAPKGAAEGEKVLVVLLNRKGDGVRETYRATVEDGEVKLPARTFGTLYFFAAETDVEETPEVAPDEEPETKPEDPPSGDKEGESAAESEEASPALLVALIALGAVLAASAAVVFVKKKQTSASLDEVQTKQGEPESETEGSVGVTPEEKE